MDQAEFRIEKIAILHDKCAYGKGWRTRSRRPLNKAGLKEALYEAYQCRREGLHGAGQQMKQAKIDIIVLGGYHTAGGDDHAGPEQG